MIERQGNLFMTRESGDKFVEILHRENGEVIKSQIPPEFQEEVIHYTINGELLDSRGKVLYDLTAIRIHMIDFGFDEFDKDVYDYVQDQITKTREDIDEGKDLEAAARVICMQLVLGIEVKMASAVKEIRSGKVTLPEEFSSETIKRVIIERLANGEEDNRNLLEDKLFNPDGDDAILKKTRGNK